MNPRYIFAVSHHKLIHGGLGHRPLLCEELVLLGLNCKSFGFFVLYAGFMENILNLAFHCSILASLSVKYQCQFGNLIPSLSHLKTFYLAHKSCFETEEKGFSRPESLFSTEILSVGISGA